MDINEQLRLIASHAVSATAGSFDVRRARSEILTLWANARPKGAKAVALADTVVGALRDASESSLKSPPYILIQAAAVIADVISRPFDPDAGRAVIADPVYLISRLVPFEETKTLKQLYETPETTHGRTAVLAGAAGLLGIGVGAVLSRVLGRAGRQGA